MVTNGTVTSDEQQHIESKLQEQVTTSSNSSSAVGGLRLAPNCIVLNAIAILEKKEDGPCVFS